MFVDFDKVFSKTPQTEMKIPNELVEQLSSRLPEQFVFVVDKSTNTLFISDTKSEDELLEIDGIILSPTNEQLKILGSNFDYADILNLSYNSQKPVPIKFKDDKYVIIKGNDIPVEYLNYNPFKSQKIKMNSQYLYPPKFPQEFTLPIGCDGLSIELRIIRVPNDSVSVMTFESTQGQCLSIKYSMDLKTNGFVISINTMLQEATTIKEIVDSIRIYNAFVKGEGYMAGMHIGTKLNTKNGDMIDEKTLRFWEKIYELESELNVRFLPPYTDIDFEDICNIEEIYQNIVNKNPIRKNMCVSSITSHWEFSKDNIVDENFKKPIYFEFEGTYSFKLFGHEFNLPCLVGIFNAVISNYEKNGEECTLFLESESEEKKMYTSNLCFLSELSRSDYKNNTKERICIFRDAKKGREYLSD